MQVITPTVDEVKSAIHDAWEDVPYPGDDHVWGDDRIGFDRDTGRPCDAIGDDMRGKHWSDLSVDVLERHSWKYSLFFMELVTWHFFLPAFLIAAMTDNEVLGHVGFALTPPDEATATPGEVGRFLDRMARLSYGQKQAIALWWAYLDATGQLFESDGRALSYWRRYVPAADRDRG